MNKEQAMGEFVKYLDNLCPLFKPYVQAHKAEKDEQERRRWVISRLTHITHSIPSDIII